jgi:hypothetical protein
MIQEDLSFPMLEVHLTLWRRSKMDLVLDPDLDQGLGLSLDLDLETLTRHLDQDQDQEAQARLLPGGRFQKDQEVRLSVECSQSWSSAEEEVLLVLMMPQVDLVDLRVVCLRQVGSADLYSDLVTLEALLRRY